MCMYGYVFVIIWKKIISRNLLHVYSICIILTVVIMTCNNTENLLSPCQLLTAALILIVVIVFVLYTIAVRHSIK